MTITRPKRQYPEVWSRSTDFPHFSGFPTAICSRNHVPAHICGQQPWGLFTYTLQILSDLLVTEVEFVLDSGTPSPGKHQDAFILCRPKQTSRISPMNQNKEDKRHGRDDWVAPSVQRRVQMDQLKR